MSRWPLNPPLPRPALEEFLSKPLVVHEGYYHEIRPSADGGRFRFVKVPPPEPCEHEWGEAINAVARIECGFLPDGGLLQYEHPKPPAFYMEPSDDSICAKCGAVRSGLNPFNPCE